MKKALIYCTVFALTLFSCEKEIDNLSKTTTIISPTNTTQKLTSFSFNLGISSLEKVFEDLTSKKFIVHAEDNYILNSTVSNYDGYQITQQSTPSNKIIFKVNNKEKKETIFILDANEKSILVNGTELKYIKSENLNANLKDDIRIGITLIIELIKPDISRTFRKNSLRVACTATLGYLDYTKSGALDGLKDYTSRYLSSHSDCKAIHSQDSACIWGDYGCVATQEISCSGGTCNSFWWN